MKWLQVCFGQESVQHFREVGSRQNNSRLPGEVREREREKWRELCSSEDGREAEAWETVPSIECTSPTIYVIAGMVNHLELTAKV